MGATSMIEKSVLSAEVICKAMDFCVENKKVLTGRHHSPQSLAIATVLFLKTLCEELYEPNEKT